MAVVTAMVSERMSCRCIHEQWQRDRDKQRDLAKKTAIMLEKPVVLFRKPDGRYCFVVEGENYDGEFIELLTQY